MSLVTNLVLVTSIDEPGVAVVQAWFAEHHPNTRLVQVDELVVGPKGMECDVFIAAVNYLDEISFFELWKDLDWRWEEGVVLIRNREGSTVLRAGEVPYEIEALMT